MPNTQFFQQPFLYTNGLQISNNATTPNTKLDVTSGQARDNTNVADMLLSSGVTIDATINGAGGLDTGSLGANKMYAVLEIASTKNLAQPAMMLSLSSTAPVMPQNYDVFAVKGYWPTDGSSHFYAAYTAGSGGVRQFYYDSAVSVLSGGSATSLTNIDLSNVVPAVNNTPVLLNVSFTPNAAADKVSIAPGGSSSTGLVSVSGCVATKAQTGYVKALSRLVSSAPTIRYINSAASGSATIAVSGFEYFV